MQPIDAANKADMLMFFSCLWGSPICRYTLNWQTVQLTLNASQIPA